LVFVDESGIRLGSPVEYGWSPRGKTLPGYHVQGCWETITLIGAIAMDGFRGFMTVDSGTSSDVFEAFVSQQLTPELKPGDIVVLDNLSAHKNPRAAQAIANAGSELLFTPPYSPEFNPIERLWSKMKQFVRRCETLRRDLLDEAVAKAMELVSHQDILGWVSHAGYRLS